MQTFRNQEAAFKKWIAQHVEDGYLLNVIKGPAGTTGWPYMLHRVNCSRFTAPNRRSGKNFTTNKYFKVCSTKIVELASWAKQERGEHVPKCKLCF